MQNKIFIVLDGCAGVEWNFGVFGAHLFKVDAVMSLYHHEGLIYEQSLRGVGEIHRLATMQEQWLLRELAACEPW